MKVTCDEATAICDKNQYGEASFWEKMKLSLHILLCKKCGRYSKQNNIMTKCYEKQNHIPQKEHCLNEEEKDVMKQEVLEKI